MANLKNGDNGSEVVQLQTLLINVGYTDIKADGAFGMMTENAVKDFQSKHNLSVDGIAGNSVMTALNGTSKTPAASDEDLVRGIDVSHYQAFPDWKKIKASGISFAYIKVTE